VAVLGLAYLVSFVDRTILSLLIEPIKGELRISDTQIALLQGTAFGLFYITLGVPFGWAVDRWPRTRVIGFGCALWCAMTAVCGIASSFAQLFLARLGVGVGEAALSPGAASMIADLFPPRRRALAMSVYAMGASLGAGLSMIAGGLIIGWAGSATAVTVPIAGPLAPWRLVLVMVGIFGLLVAVAVLALGEPVRRTGPLNHVGEPQALIPFLRSTGGLLGPQFVGIALYGLVSYAVLSWVPAIFIRLHGWTAPQTGLRFGIVFLVFGGLGALAGGGLSAALARKNVGGFNLLTALVGVTVMTPFVIAAPLVENGWVALALLAPVAFCFAVPTGASIAAVQEVTPPGLRGQVAALYYLVIGLVGLLLGPLSVAVLTDDVFQDPLKIGWSLATVCLIVQPLAIGSLWLAYRHARRRSFDRTVL
jgi:MFS family permease